VPILTRETKAQIAQRMSFEEIYAQVSRLKIHKTEIDVNLNRLNGELNTVNSEIYRWNSIASEKRKALVTAT